MARRAGSVQDKYRNRYEVERARTEELIELAHVRVAGQDRRATARSLLLYLPGWFWYKVMPDIPKYIICRGLSVARVVLLAVRRVLFWQGLRLDAALSRSSELPRLSRLLRRWHGREGVVSRWRHRLALLMSRGQAL